MPFYESLRTALSRYAAFVHTVEQPASPAELLAASERLLRPLPESYLDFLRSFNGVMLFHEALVLHPIAAVRPAGPADRFLYVGDTGEGALWLDRDGKLRLVDEEEPDPIVCGSEVERWLEATLAREALVIDREGEFREVFEEDSESLTLAVRRKRAALGVKRDPGAALYLLEQAELLFEDDDIDGARLLLQKAVALDPEAGPAWELLTTLLQKLGQLPAAEHAALQAAAATWDPFLRASRLLDAAQLMPEQQSKHAAAAAAADPEHAQRLFTQAQELIEEGGHEEAQRLVHRLQLLVAHSQAAPQSAAELARLLRELRTRGALRLV
jgi:tetratricopeptide (TPR) repeat protein